MYCCERFAIIRKSLGSALLYLPDGSSSFRLRGPDAARYLQGRITQDVKNLNINELKWSLLLSPQGKIQGKFLLRKIEENDFIIHSDPLSSNEQRDDFLSELLRFKVADQFECEAIDERLIFLFPADGEGLTSANRVPFGREQIIISGANEIDIPSETTTLSEEQFHQLRVAAGEPWMGIDISEKIIGTEIGAERYISFSKGCYSGQEVVEMSTARGKANKLLCQFRSKEKLAAEMDVDNHSGARVGFISSAISFTAEGAEEFLALGYLKSNAINETLQTANATAISYNILHEHYAKTDE